MADNIVDISLLSPLKWVKEGYTQNTRYNTRYMDDYIYQDTIPSWYAQQSYFAPWQTNDAIPLQILSNYAPHQLLLVDCHGDEVPGAVFQFVHKPSSIEGSGVKAFEFTHALADYDEGVYRYKIKSGDPVIDGMRSEWFYLKETHENTILLEYSHDENDYETVFETGIKPCFRVHGGFPPEGFQPATTRTVFVDQPENIVQLNSRSFSTEKLLLGDSWGLPAWVIQKINQIFQCSTVLIDGKQYVANDGAKLDPNTLEEYPMTGWSLEVRPAKADGKKRFVSEGNQGSPTSVVYQIEGIGFGPITGGASSNIIKIPNVG